ncbi:MAG: GlcNAc-PI de-N-acetylase [Bdellovibrionales bacterium CG10_big_fil_rev_8_21_14_0_10_45_34]|nr:MAG: GlcNAc-PI de-N-acetylase [Bdellovibrionales bacterium CG10_big_fil_rev_8_21_14_0_10_45_34]
MSNILVVAPHADDETLGCGAYLFKQIGMGHNVTWLLVTQPTDAQKKDFFPEGYENRLDEVHRFYGFRESIRLGMPTARLDTVPMQDLTSKIAEVIRETSAETILIPFRNDIHTDHKVTFDATFSATKWFRNSTVKRIMAYETLSETEFSAAQIVNGFSPNLFVNVTNELSKKVEAMRIYSSELGNFPYPRSVEAIQALAQIRGATSGHRFAEAFQIIKEIQD